MGLIARVIETAGIPTLCMTSAWDITAAVSPPRSAFVHYPLGHQSGALDDPKGQREIVRSALEAALSMKHPGEIVPLPFRWEHESGWEDRAYTPEHSATGPEGKPLRD